MKEKKKNKDELKEKLLSASRKATFFEPIKCKIPPPSEQMFTSHIGGVPYFEKGIEWRRDDQGEPFQFIFQIFQDDANSLALPEGVKLLQLFFNWDEKEGHIVLYRELKKENAVLVDFEPLCKDDDNDEDDEENNVEDNEDESYEYLEDSIEYMELSLKTVNMIPDIESKAEKDICNELGITESSEKSYLGGYYCSMTNSWSPDIPVDAVPLFQLYLYDGAESPYNWKNYYDAMIYAWINNKTKECTAILDINYD